MFKFHYPQVYFSGSESGSATVPAAGGPPVPAVETGGVAPPVPEPVVGAGGSPPEGQAAGGSAPVVASPPDWALQRIDEQTRQLRERDARIADMERQLAADTKEGVPASEVQQRATLIAAQTKFDEDCSKVASKGQEVFKDFSAVMTNFQRIGGTTTPFLLAMLEQDEPERVIYELGKDLGEATRIMKLDPVRQAAAITKYALKLGNKTPVVVDPPVVVPEKIAEGAAPRLTSGSPALPGVVGTGRGNGGPARLDDNSVPMDKWVEERNKSAWDRQPRRRRG